MDRPSSQKKSNHTIKKLSYLSEKQDNVLTAHKFFPYMYILLNIVFPGNSLNFPRISKNASLSSRRIWKFDKLYINPIQILNFVTMDITLKMTVPLQVYTARIMVRRHRSFASMT